MYAKRLITKTAASEYLGMGTSLFTKLVSQNKLPQPIRISERRIVWDIQDLDDHIETMKEEAVQETKRLSNMIESDTL
jgi:predicted DNA-binding transcriptional regulator AlpA|tara:strand:+ start:5117 stop:5350 length:234 start_codon:yes stop_codon:yes gene_type:complete